jgi:hypothetical protein
LSPAAIVAALMGAALAAQFYCCSREEVIRKTFKQQLTPPFFLEPNGGASFSV